MGDPVPGPSQGVLAPGALSESALESYLDLGPFLNTSYHVVQVRRRAWGAGCARVARVEFGVLGVGVSVQTQACSPLR
jgi:hypothetical protein